MEYSLTVYQRVHEAGILGLFRVEGPVQVEMVEGFSLVGEDFTLDLEGGRVLDFFLADNSGGAFGTAVIASRRTRPCRNASRVSWLS